MVFSSPGQRVITPRTLLLAVFAVALVVLKCVYIRGLGVESDESQHLHVVWGWTQGQVQYRDFFDNHTPLFHMLYAPLLAFLGERPDILVPMRVAILPLFAITLFAVYWLGARLYSREAGLWAAVFTGFFPVFVDTTSQFRTDNLWLAAWLSVLAIALTGRATKRRALLAGLLLGAAFSVSMKTSLLLVSLLFAAGLVLGWRAWREGGDVLRRSIVLLGPLVAGMCIVPGMLLVFFASKHALSQMYYCVIQHNNVPGLGNWHKQPFRRVIFPVALPVILAAGYAIFRSAKDKGIATRRTILFLTAAIFTALLESYWPLVTNQDFPPVIPLFCVVLTPVVLDAGEWLWTKAGFSSQARLVVFCAALLPVLLIGLEMKMAIQALRRSKEGIQPFCDHLAHMLQLTRPNDNVMDAKGATIFRRRPFYFAIENITQARMGLGLIPNTIVNDIVKTNTCVVCEERIPVRATMPWVQRHYIPVARGVYVAGSWLAPQNESCTFEVVIPSEYTIVSSTGPVATGTLDGVPFQGRAFLSAGQHTYRSGTREALAVVWAQATDTGSSPFHWWKETGKR